MEHVVGFAGYECEDIVVYLARMINAFGKKVAIVDRTEQEMLIEVLGIEKHGEEAAREGFVSGIWITSQGANYEEYDVVFILFGYRLLHPKLYECQTLFMVTDGVPAHASLLRKIGQWERKQYLLIRNLVPMKHTEQYLAMLAEHEEEYCEIPYDERDIRMRCSLSSYTRCAIKHLSEGMRRALVILAQIIMPEYQGRQLREIMKKL